jgi:membrane protease YdiL (CAAX protease family)
MFRLVFAAIAALGLALVAPWLGWLPDWLPDQLAMPWLREVWPFLMLVLAGFALVFGLAARQPARHWLALAGLTRWDPPMMGVVLLALAPAVASFTLFGRVNAALPAPKLLLYAGLVPLAEELFFRGTVFVGLRRFARLSFWPAALIPAIGFGLGHLYQAPTLALKLGVFIVTAGTGVVLAWLVEQARGSLWPAIVLHMGLNGLWLLFLFPDAWALPGGAHPESLLRALTLTLVVGLGLMLVAWPRLRGAAALQPP